MKQTKMDFFEVVNGRRPIRAFTSRPVEEAKLARILEAAGAAPSGGEQPGYDILVASVPEVRAELAKTAGERDLLATAPVLLVFCAHSSTAARESGQEAMLGSAFAMLAATALGLDTAWVGTFAPDAVRAALRLDDETSPIAILPVGYSSAE